MSDTSKSEPAVPATTTPAEPVVAADAATTEVAEPVAAEPVAVAEPAPVVPAEPAPRPKRGVGAWGFVLGLLTVLVDIGFVVLLAVTVAGLIGDISSGDLGISTAIGGAGLVLLAFFIFFGGFLTAGLGALLGLVALIGGRGRVLGLFGLLFAAAALAVRVLLLVSGNFIPELG